MRKTLLLSVLTISFYLAKSADFYWVGGSGDWTDLNHWATTSGGIIHPVILPTATDDVYFDANSFTAPGQTVSLSIDGTCRNLNCSGVTNNPTIQFEGSSSRTLNIYGSLTLVAGMNIFYQYGYGTWAFRSTATGKTVISAGKDLVQARFEGTSGEWSLLDPLNASSTVFVIEGTFNTNNFTINTGEFNSTTGCGGCNIRTINLGSSTINCTVKWNTFGAALTLNTGTSLIKTPYFQSVGTASYYDAEMNGATINEIRVTGNPTFHNLDFTAGNSLEFTGSLGWGDITVTNRLGLDHPGSTIKFMAGSVVSVAGNIVLPNSLTGCTILTTIRSNITGSAAVLSQSSGSVTGSHLVLQDMTAAGAAIFTANQSINVSGNTGWTINPPSSSSDFYWIGGTGKLERWKPLVGQQWRPGSRLRPYTNG